MIKNIKNISPKVSVLMPVYKTPDTYLVQAIESILNQTFTDFEFLILDDCPEYPVEHIVKQYKDKRICYLKNEKNMGIAEARNKLIRIAKGEYLAVMDHDDISLPQRLEKEVIFLDNNPKVGVVGTYYECFPNIKVRKKFVINSQIETDLMYNCSVLHPSSMIRKSVLLDNNIFYEKKYSPAEDYALWVSLIGKTQFHNIPEILFRYRNHKINTSKVQAEKMKNASKEIHAFLEKKYAKLMKKASDVQKIYFCGIPIAKIIYRGENYKIKWFGIFKTSGKNEILTDNIPDIPIYIISYNRLSYLQKMIQWLEKYNIRNIHIIDNNSSYPPLLQYLENTPYTVHRMGNNMGHMVFFKADEFKHTRENEYYILTDPDVIPIDECPAHFINYFFHILKKYPNVTKVGFSLKTDDIPNDLPSTNVIRKWEKQFYKKKLTLFPPYLYNSYIDTTFALYRPMKKITKDNFYKAIRTGYPYEARHLPWYKDLSVLNEEDKFYNKTDAGSGNWNNLENLDNIKNFLISKSPDKFIENIFSIKKSNKRIVVRIIGMKFTIKRKDE